MPSALNGTSNQRTNTAYVLLQVIFVHVVLSMQTDTDLYILKCFYVISKHTRFVNLEYSSRFAL